MSHARDFGLESGNEDAAKRLIYDYRTADLSADDLVLCEYAVRLTLSPKEVGRTDVDVLKQAGFDDVQISVAVQVIGYFNYINRIAEGFGVDDEDWMTITREEWQSKKVDFRA